MFDCGKTAHIMEKDNNSMRKDSKNMQTILYEKCQQAEDPFFYKDRESLDEDQKSLSEEKHPLQYTT